MQIHTPLTAETIKSVRVGDAVEITGPIYAARDAAHKRMLEALARGEDIPIDLEAGNLIYYVGPTPPRPGAVIGAAGPTTSMRMDAFCAGLIPHGLKATMGKGGRGPELRDLMRQHGAIYFLAVGGSGALLSQHIKKAEVIAYEDLGTEAIRLLTVENFPAVVCNDVEGRDLLEEGKAKWARKPVGAADKAGLRNGGG
jgi:fumarate hydratase subunit beta